MGPGTFLQSAGFLRIREGDNPLDGSAVHPEAYPVAERIMKATGRSIAMNLSGIGKPWKNLNPSDFTDTDFRRTYGQGHSRRTLQTRQGPPSGIRNSQFPGGS